VQSALQSVKGVKEAKVSLETHEAVVKYDPEQVKVEEPDQGGEKRPWHARLQR
jgi:copper chaperone CopZ